MDLGFEFKRDGLMFSARGGVLVFTGVGLAVFLLFGPAVLSPGFFCFFFCLWAFLFVAR
jgi:hypothetical protein